jgi:Uma2 family endonuclease
MSLAYKKKSKYTYADYRNWPDGLRCEILHGIIYDMTPAPLRKHQLVLGELHGQFWNFLKDKKCRAYMAPFDVRLPRGDEADDDIDTVVQPDISIICDSRKLDELGCRGAPDLIVEILSPSTASKDQKEKLALYEKHGVKEYWIVQPDNKIVMVFQLSKTMSYGKPDIYTHEDTINVKRFKGLVIDLASVFAEE